MKCRIEPVIADFDAMVRMVSPNVARKLEYESVKGSWPAYLRYLQPLVTGRYLHSVEALDRFWPEFLKDKLSIDNEQVSERAIHFGIMAASILVVLKRREGYPAPDFDELAKLCQTKSLYPIESLKSQGFFDRVNINGLDVLLQGFLRLHVKPLIRLPQKSADAFSHFETQFFSGILLGELVTFLILRDHYKQKPPGKTT